MDNFISHVTKMFTKRNIPDLREHMANDKCVYRIFNKKDKSFRKFKGLKLPETITVIGNVYQK